LNSRVDRRTEFYNQVDKAGVGVVRVSAIQSDSVGRRHSTPSGVSACWLSHQKAFRLFLETGEEYGFFFEDDAIFRKNSFDFILKFDSLPKPDFDILQIGYLKNRGRLDSGKFDFLVRWKFKCLYLIQKFKISRQQLVLAWGGQILIPDSFEAGTHAYVCSRAMAEKLITFNNPVILAADLALIQIARSKTQKCFRLAQSLVGQSNSVSSINLRQNS
jgi:GR25 family glycosyltransferase involved in LPS biosynthesis